MKVLYATYRYDPNNPDMGSSLDFELYSSLLRAGFDVSIVGPVTNVVPFFERVELFLWRVYKKVTNKRGLKFPLTTSLRASRLLRQATQHTNPDVVFSIFQPFYLFLSSGIPRVWYFDTTFLGQEESWPLYGRLPLAVSVWQERRVFRRVTRVITMSQWSKNILLNQYGVPSEKIEVIPACAALPTDIIPGQVGVNHAKRLTFPIRLLLVGRVYERKGIDIAIETVQLLNALGLPANLTVCGLNERAVNLPNVQFVGPYRKSDPQQLRAYADLYQQAHLLLHPARFEAAGIVPSEAAAFGTPTLTNDTGGLATTVKDGESGIVLPRNSPFQAYVQAIRDLVSQPERYYALCRSTRLRYERELNSDVAGKRLAQILRDVAGSFQKKDTDTCC